MPQLMSHKSALTRLYPTRPDVALYRNADMVGAITGAVR